MWDRQETYSVFDMTQPQARNATREAAARSIGYSLPSDSGMSMYALEKLPRHKTTVIGSMACMETLLIQC